MNKPQKTENLIEKESKDSNRYFTKEAIPLVSKYTRRCLISIVMREIPSQAMYGGTCWLKDNFRFGWGTGAKSKLIEPLWKALPQYWLKLNICICPMSGHFIPRFTLDRSAYVSINKRICHKYLNSSIYNSPTLECTWMPLNSSYGSLYYGLVT